MNESAFFRTLIQESYDLEHATLHAIHYYQDEGRAVYRLLRPDGASCTARLYQRSRPGPDLLHACGTKNWTEWLRSRAMTLTWLEQQGYPAPQVVRTRSGEVIGQSDGWDILMTTFFEGTVIKPTLEQLRLLGVALGKLHRLPVENAQDGVSSVGKSYWYPEQVIPAALAQLASAQPQMPAEWEPLHTASCQTLRRIQAHPHLSRAIIHGDPWAANAVQTAPDQVALIDWDVAGVGLALIDLGKLLLECHLDSNLPASDALAWHIQPDPARINAVVDGYCQQRMPTPAEVDLLLEGVRFGIAFISAIHFDYVLRHGSDPSLERRYARMQNRLAASEEVAAIALRRFRRGETGN